MEVFYGLNVKCQKIYKWKNTKLFLSPIAIKVKEKDKLKHT